MPGGFGAKFGFPWLMTGFVDDWEWGFGDELGADELLPILKDGDCGDVCGCGVDEKSVDLFGKIDMPVLLGITNCGEALPFNGVGDEEAEAHVALLWQKQNIITKSILLENLTLVLSWVRSQVNCFWFHCFDQFPMKSKHINL